MGEGAATKQALGRALMELTAQKGFDKVSVGQITQACDLGRQSFYYHFQDKFQLLEWVLHNNAFAPMSNGVTLQNWPARMEQMLKEMEDERRFYVAAVKAQPDFFAHCLSSVMEPLFESLSDYICAEVPLPLRRKAFGSKFYALGCSAVVTRWAQAGMRTPAKDLAEDIYMLAKDSEWAARRIADELSRLE